MNSFRTGVAVVVLATLPSLGEANVPVDLSGVWAQRIVTTAESKLPVIGKVENTSKFYALTTISHTQDKLALDVEPCWVRMDGEVKRVKTIVPEETVAVMGPSKRKGAYDGSTVVIKRAVDVLGARLANEWRDPLPTGPKDSSAFDEDRDGKPGVTIRIMGPVDGEVYVAQRSWNEMRGTISSDRQRIHGLTQWYTDQEVLGGSSMFLRANPSSKPHPDKTRSYFDMVRMPAGTSCADIKRQNDQLFKESQ